MESNRRYLAFTALYVFLTWVAWLIAQVVALWFAKIVFTTVSSRDFMGFFVISTAIAFVGTVLIIFRKRKVQQ